MKRKLFLLFIVLLLGITTIASAQSSAPFGIQVVRLPAAILLDDVEVGTAEFWNTRNHFMVDMALGDDWLLQDVQVYLGDEPTATDFIAFMYNPSCYYALPEPDANLLMQCDLKEELNFSWGNNSTRYVSIRANVIKLDDNGVITDHERVWVAYEPTLQPMIIRRFVGWYFSTTIVHPQRGHFIDSPVAGLTYETPTNWGMTDDAGGFDYFPGERVSLSIGSVPLGTPIAGQKTSPLNVFENADIDDPRVINMARLLQSLDVDGEPQSGINITEDVTGCLDQAMLNLGLTEVDFADDLQTEAVIQETIDQCAGVESVNLISVSAADAQANLDKALSSDMLRKNISRTPDLSSSKSKLNIMGMWFPALKANDDPAVFTDESGGEIPGVPYYDDEGNLIRVADEAKPVVVVYTDGVPETGYEDIFAAISRDDGNTFKHANLSRAADRSSFTLADGTDYYGQAKKPVFGINGNNILVAWSSKFCNGGKPAYAIDLEDDYIYDDPYYVDDIWGVGGPQRSIDYTDLGYPEVGEVPYSCVWTARGTIVTQGMINSGGFWADKAVGEIVWFKPERLTSGRRDANQIFVGTGQGAGFAISWQEDPEGLRPGSAEGPGPGWGGATTNHKTDIWYSYITMTDFRKIDANFVAGGDPEHDDPDFVGRPKALVPMALPIRLSDNDVVNTDNLMVELGGDGYPVTDENGNWIPIINPDTDGDGEGTHIYGYAVEGLCESFYEFTNEQGELKKVCVTADNRLLDGDTGASRPNLFLQTYTKPDGTKSAWAIMAYEETKGVGLGAPDHDPDGGPYGDDYLAESGKNVIYHSFDFQNPDLVSAGNILNFPEMDEEGNLLYLQDEEGNLMLDWQGLPQLAYENARRPRFILQSKSAVGASSTVLLVLYKEGQDGMGRPSDIMLRRVEAPGPGNPYRYENFICDEWVTAVNGETVCVAGVQNMSSVTPTETWINPDSDPDAVGDGIKVIRWEQTIDNLSDPSWLNPYDDARAHRGQIRGDFVVMGFTYTPNWAAARNGNDKYDFYVRRSFDGGQTWTTDPAGSGVTHCDIFSDPLTHEKEEVCTFYPAGGFEAGWNLSQLPNNDASVIEPRIVAVPGTIKNPATGLWTGIPEDKQDPNVFYVSYGTSTNPPQVHGDSEEEEVFAAPMDLFYSFSQDRGESYVEIAWDVNPDSEGNFAGETVYRWDYLAKGDPEQGEAQLRMTPDGSRFYATWLQEGEEGSDIWFRRITPSTFPANNLP